MRDIYSVSQLKKVSAGELLSKYPKASMPQPTVAELKKKIEAIEKEMAIQMAIETFLDCDYDKVKISKRVAKVPKSARGTVRGKSVRIVSASVKGAKPMISKSRIFA